MNQVSKSIQMPEWKDRCIMQKSFERKESACVITIHSVRKGQIMRGYYGKHETQVHANKNSA